MQAPPVKGCLPPAPPGLPQVWLRKRIQVIEPLAERVIWFVAPRQPHTIFLDEGKNIMWEQDVEEVERHFNRLKTVANNTHAFITLGMAYDGLKLWDPDAQLVRRIKPVHFRRYGPGAEDQHHFRDALTRLIERLPLPAAFEPKLELFYANTNGCVGVLAEWLGRALKLAAEQGAETVTGEHVLAEVLPFAQVSSLLRDALAGESHPWTRPARPTVAEWEAHLEALGLRRPDVAERAGSAGPECDASAAPTDGRDAASAGRRSLPRKRRRSRRPRDEHGMPIPGTTEVDAIHALRDFEPAPHRYSTGLHPEDADALDPA